MEITNDGLPWNSDDEFRWNAFLQTDTGRRLLPKLAEKVPALLSGGQVNEILIRSGEVLGFQLAISSLLELTHSSPLPMRNSPENYPSPEDDEKWNDGQNINK